MVPASFRRFATVDTGSGRIDDIDHPLADFLPGDTWRRVKRVSTALYLIADNYLHRQVNDRLETVLHIVSSAIESGSEGVEW